MELVVRIVVIASLIIAGVALTRRRRPCINGSPEGDRCICEDGWTGDKCMRRMNCSGFERNTDGSCVECSLGWQGANCDVIYCHENGEPNFDQSQCTCNKPYSGQYCEKSDTKDIYLWYNNFNAQIGPLGLITIIPLIILMLTCERMAKNRQENRVEEHLTGTFLKDGKPVNREIIKRLMAQKSIDDTYIEISKALSGQKELPPDHTQSGNKKCKCGCISL